MAFIPYSEIACYRVMCFVPRIISCTTLLSFLFCDQKRDGSGRQIAVFLKEEMAINTSLFGEKSVIGWA